RGKLPFLLLHCGADDCQGSIPVVGSARFATTKSLRRDRPRRHIQVSESLSQSEVMDCIEKGIIEGIRTCDRLVSLWALESASVTRSDPLDRN
ncbi:hypothetical protein AKJ16_DCAP13460, partial [Drosera capensis]